MFNREGLMSDERRQFIKGSAALAAGAAVNAGAWAAGSDAPEKKEVRIGFIPLTDCASVVMASVLKFDEKYGIKIIPTKEASWAGVRDTLIRQDPTLADPANPVVKIANDLVNDKEMGPIARSHPNGLKAAVGIARLMIEANAHRLQVQKLREEVKRLSSLPSSQRKYVAPMPNFDMGSNASVLNRSTSQ